MKKTTIAMMVLIGAGVAQASIILDQTANHDRTSFTWTVSDLNLSPPTVNTSAGSIAVPTGDLTAGQAGQSFNITFQATGNWNASVASTTGDIGNYLANLGYGATINGVNNYWAINSAGDNDINTISTNSEALVATINTDTLTDTLILKDMGMQLVNVGDNADLLVFDASSNAWSYSAWDVGAASYNGGDVVLENGDMIVVAGASMNNGWRFDTLTVDVIPEPATLGLVTAFGAGILFVRRRFMM